ncbi:hypothetical protein ACIA5D_51520 [Actinoplanes sp. NPDC051513]|uniref:effector-associated constant component EACC1 n=1 Tax=Actinoplanes sp. NPDC051513 TaxID=3363908 RepID=UPI0037919A76
MEMSLRLAGEPEELLSLEAALRTEPGVRGSRLGRVVRDSRPGEQGPTTDALTWASDNKELLGGLTAALAAWLTSRRTRIIIISGDTKVEVNSTNVPDPEALALTLLEATRGHRDDV